MKYKVDLENKVLTIYNYSKKWKKHKDTLLRIYGSKFKVEERDFDGDDYTIGLRTTSGTTYTTINMPSTGTWGTWRTEDVMSVLSTTGTTITNSE